jgi:hypothetical protein
MKNKIEDLRNHLFATLEALGDREAPMDIARAKAIAEVGQTIINSAKIEVDFLKVIGEQKSRKLGSDFIPAEPRPALPMGDKHRLSEG